MSPSKLKGGLFGGPFHVGALFFFQRAPQNFPSKFKNFPLGGYIQGLGKLDFPSEFLFFRRNIFGWPPILGEDCFLKKSSF